MASTTEGDWCQVLYKALSLAKCSSHSIGATFQAKLKMFCKYSSKSPHHPHPTTHNNTYLSSSFVESTSAIHHGARPLQEHEATQLLDLLLPHQVERVVEGEGLRE